MEALERLPVPGNRITHPGQHPEMLSAAPPSLHWLARKEAGAMRTTKKSLLNQI